MDKPVSLAMFIILLGLLPAVLLHREANSSNRFSVDLIHRDSPLSPFYISSLTREELIQIAAHRSFSRLTQFSKQAINNANPIKANITSDSWVYFIKFGIGTPPVELLLQADTGSDLTWIECAPCEEYCFGPSLFDPKKSSTYRGRLPCYTSPCSLLRDEFRQCSVSNGCLYEYSYGDNSYSNGELSTETLTFDSFQGKAVSVPNVTFGCSHEAEGAFSPPMAGIASLGGGPLSLILQMIDLTDSIFGYCLVPFEKGSNSTSTMYFGFSTLSRKGFVTAYRIVKEGDLSSFYFLRLLRVGIGDNSTKEKELGDIILDMGSSLTMLAPEIYNPLKTLVLNSVKLEPSKKPIPKHHDLCYETTSPDVFPNMTFYFYGPWGDAGVTLTPTNTFQRQYEDLWCMGLVPNWTSNNRSIFGMNAMVNFLIEIDIEDESVWFLPTDCTQPYT